MLMGWFPSAARGGHRADGGLVPGREGSAASRFGSRFYLGTNAQKPMF